MKRKNICMEINLLTLDKINNEHGQSLSEALEIYHELVKKNIIKPRENQLNKSGMIPQGMQFNTNLNSNMLIQNK